MSDTLAPHDRACDACNHLDRIHGEMVFLTSAIPEVMDDDKLASGVGYALDRITADLGRLSSEFWALAKVLPQPQEETAHV